MDKNIIRSGLVSFKDYTTKLRMLSHPMYLFGLKMHDQIDNVEFVDADFCNTL